MNDSANRSVSLFAAATWAVLLSAAHGVVWVILFVTLFVFVPSFKQRFADFAMKLPWLTELVIDISDGLLERWLVLPVLFVTFTALDTAVLFLLRRQRATAILGWLWFVLILLLPIGLTLLAWLAILLPMAELSQGLAE